MESAGPEYEKTRPPAECPIATPLPAGHATEAENEDSRIGVSDKLEGTYAWNPAKKELKLEANGKLTLAGSKYYLCNFEASSNSTLVIAAGAHVEMFIDSPGAEGSKCSAGTGKFEAGGAFVAENLSKNPAALLIEMSGGPFVFSNGKKSCAPNACLEASVYAPKGEVTINGGTPR